MGKNIYLRNLVISLIFAVLAFLIPLFFVKVIFTILGIIFLAANMKSHRIAFIILALIFFIIPLSAGFVVTSSGFSWNDYVRSNLNNTMVIEPDTYIDSAENINIQGAGVELIFDETSEKIYIPHQVRQSRRENTLFLTSDLNKKIRIVVGTKNPYKNVRINSTSLSTSGTLKTEHFYADTTSLKFNANIEAASFFIDSTSFSLNTDLKAHEVDIDGTSIHLIADIYANDLNIDGTTIKWHGFTNATNIDIDGTTLDIDLNINGSKNIAVDGTNINIKIKYQDTWQEKRCLRVEGTIGDLEIIEPLSNQGYLETVTEGKIRVKRNTY